MNPDTTLYWVIVLAAAMFSTGVLVLVWLDSPTARQRRRDAAAAEPLSNLDRLDGLKEDRCDEC